MTDIIELAKQAGFKVDEEGEPFIYFNEQWIDVTAELTKFAQLLQQGEAGANDTLEDATYGQNVAKYGVDVANKLYEHSNTQAKLDKAREALKRLAEMQIVEQIDTIEQALKET